MKRCSYCGKEYPDDATVCQFDQQPLVDPAAPKPSPEKTVVIDARPTVAAAVFAFIMAVFCLAGGILLLVFKHGKDGSAYSGLGLGIMGFGVGFKLLKAAKKSGAQNSRRAIKRKHP